MGVLRYIFKTTATLSVLAIPCSADAGLISMGIVTLIAIPTFFLSLVGIDIVSGVTKANRSNKVSGVTKANRCELLKNERR